MKSGTFETLNENHPLFSLLKRNPSWWQTLKSDGELYIAIRKDNYLDVYYQDGCVVKIQMIGKRNKLVITTHKKYLSGLSYKSYGKYYGDIADYVTDSAIWENYISRIKQNIVEFYGNQEVVKKGENISEKYIQWEWAISHKSEILDLEFAYNAWEKDIRIDLAQIVIDWKTKAYNVRLTELKRVNDNRMLCKDIEKVPEIISQMKSYKKFIDDNSSSLLKYYKTIHKLKGNLGLSVLPLKEDYHIDICHKPLLSIANIYPVMNAARQKRIGVYDEKEGRFVSGMLRHIADKKYDHDFDYEIFQRVNRTIDLMDYYEYKDKQKKRSGNSKLLGHSLQNCLLVPVTNYFTANKITFWNDEREEKLESKSSDKQNKPTEHPLSSQNHCMNHLFPIMDDDDSIKAILHHVCPDIQIKSILPIPDEAYTDSGISFEFTYKNKELLHEKHDTRGANCTSIDAVIYAVDTQGKHWLFPIEWKYTELYNGKESYQGSLPRYPDLIGKKSNLTKWCPLYRMDPYYELSRQTLLAEKLMARKNSTFPVDRYVHIFVCPEKNPLYKMVQKYYVPTLKDETLFKMIDPEKLMSPLRTTKPELIAYLKERYW